MLKHLSIWPVTDKYITYLYEKAGQYQQGRGEDGRIVRILRRLDLRHYIYFRLFILGFSETRRVPHCRRTNQFLLCESRVINRSLSTCQVAYRCLRTSFLWIFISNSNRLHIPIFKRTLCETTLQISQFT